MLDAEFNVVESSTLALFFDYRQTTATGDSVIEGLGISPMEINYGWNLFLERTRDDLLYRFGWHHACDHVIHKDQDPWYEEEEVPKDVFYHSLFLAAGTQTTKPIVQARQTFENAPKSPVEKIVWYTEGAFYVRDLGSVDHQMLFAGNEWKCHFLVDLRYPLYAGSGAAVFLNNKTVLLLDIDYEAYWRDTLQLEVIFRPGKFAYSLFGGWCLIDEHPRDSHEEMTELGMRFLF